MSNSSMDLSFLTNHGLPIERFDAGKTIFLEDDVGQCLYVVRSGMVNILTYGKPLEDVGPGGIFGEIALVIDGCRSASAMAAVDTEVLKVDRAAFLKLVREEPDFALEVIKSLAIRAARG